MRGEWEIIPENSESLLELPSFTYFQTKKGHIFYSFGRGTHPKSNNINATAVYQRVSDSLNGERIGPDGHSYTKNIVDGTTPDAQKSYMAENIVTLETGESILAVPPKEVERFFDPHQALDQIIDQAFGFPEVITRRVGRTVDLLVNAGIPYENIGIYGSIQPLIFPKEIERLQLFNDVDVVVNGLKYYDHVINLAEKYFNGSMSGKAPRAVGAENLAAREKRHRLSKLQVIDEEELFYVDLRVVPSIADKIFIEAGSPIEPIRLTGRIIEAHQSLGLPAAWVVETSDNEQLVVSSRMYEHIGAAGLGDTVSISGMTTDTGNILLTNAQTDHIASTEFLEV